MELVENQYDTNTHLGIVAKWTNFEFSPLLVVLRPRAI